MKVFRKKIGQDEFEAQGISALQQIKYLKLIKKWEEQELTKESFHLVFNEEDFKFFLEATKLKLVNYKPSSESDEISISFETIIDNHQMELEDLLNLFIWLIEVCSPKKKS